MSTTPPQQGQHLRGALGDRQMTMIAIGGVIGAGLFVGSGSAIAQAGPAILIAYAAIGALVVLVMRMLAEMAVAHPDSGSFSAYATRYLGPWAGLSVGWLYAYQWCVTVGFEAIVGATLVNLFFPGVPTWFAALVLMIALISVNFIRVEAFGNFEYWFAMIKVAAIVTFLVIGIGAIAGLFPDVEAPGLSNLTGQGGFAPNGWDVVLPASLVVFFSFFGTEVVTIAAGEAKNPAEAVRRGINTVVWRILLFYIGSILIVVTLLPWNDTTVTESPYAAVLGNLGIPYADAVMRLIVLTAVLSCLNAGIYSSSRMLFAMARRGEAPSLLTRTNSRGVPVVAVLVASSAGLLTVVANYFLPTTTVYQFLLDSSGSVAVMVYLCITVTHLRAHRRIREDYPNTPVRMWGYPWLSLTALAALIAVIGGMATSESSQKSLMLTAFVTVATITAGLILQSRRSPTATTTAVSAGPRA
jgi:GABA permease